MNFLMINSKDSFFIKNALFMSVKLSNITWILNCWHLWPILMISLFSSTILSLFYTLIWSTHCNKSIHSKPFKISSTFFFDKPSLKGMFITDYFVFLVVINSFSLGTPSVTFAPPWPAKWKVFNVICVEGSPKDCAAIAPTASPGSTKHLKYYHWYISVNSFLGIFIFLRVSEWVLKKSSNLSLAFWDITPKF